MGQHCYAFYKYDGSNLRFEWSHKQGWHKFGTRTQLVDANTPIYGEAITYFLRELADGVLTRVKDHLGKRFAATRSIIAYGEFYGDHSFGGVHVTSEPKYVVIFDVWIWQRGFIEPKEFKLYFSDWAVNGAMCMYEGKLNHDFITAVQTNTLPGWNLNEGVVCKWRNPNKPNAQQSNVFMTKIKTLDYLERLRAVYGAKWEEYA